jgi:hypothetical protein
VHVDSRGTSPLRVEGTWRVYWSLVNAKLSSGGLEIALSEADGPMVRAFEVPPDREVYGDVQGGNYF